MITEFDHLVHLTKNPEEAKNTFIENGFNAVKGGRHPNWGTHNCLSFYRRLRYIEWIGLEDLDKAEESNNPLIQQIVHDAGEEGLSQVALRVDDLTSFSDRLNEKGLRTIGPLKGERKKEDGSLLQWAMLFIDETEEGPVRYPFFIQWGNSDHEREKEMASLMEHSVGKPSLSYIGYNVRNPEVAFQRFAALFHKSVTKRQDTNEFGFYLELPIGDFAFRFYDHATSHFEDISRKPVICGIRGYREKKAETIKGGVYQFTR
ncbi:VOC family protein [Pseudalkalibacillus sp. SCS-8]|uniref:VOC family protein n=1 Tax=Pseudalkalibacillus nanhaiensis TaxID=3115291 RepID=UPI0032DAB7BB